MDGSSLTQEALRLEDIQDKVILVIYQFFAKKYVLLFFFKKMNFVAKKKNASACIIYKLFSLFCYR